MIVVFDTNIWKSNLYLRSPASAAVQLFLRIREARVGLPNVVKLEVERQLRRDIIKLRSQMRDNYQRMLAVFGSLKELVLPDDNMVDQIVSQIFRNTGFNYVEMPFRLEAAEDSFLRTIDKRRPSHGPQQFKDGVLWFDCKSFALEDDVLLVSDDRAFYENDKVANGLAHELMKEIVDLPYKIKMVPNLPTLLSGIRQTPAINEESLVDAIETNAADHIEQILNNNGMRKVEVLATRITLYATEKPDLLYIEAGEDMLCEDAAGQGRTDAKLYIGVDGYYNVHSEEFSHIRTQSLELVFTDPEGERVTKRGVFLHLGAMEGHRTSVHEIRHKLSE